MMPIPNNTSQNLWAASDYVVHARETLKRQQMMHTFSTPEARENSRYLWRQLDSLLGQLRGAIASAGRWEEEFSTYQHTQQQQQP